MSGGFKVGLALGGGGVRGLAHIGVLKVFKQEALPFNLIVGTSMGAIVGGAYALSGEISTIESKILALLRRPEIANLESLAGESAPEEKKMIIERLSNFVKELLLWNLKGIKLGITDGREIKTAVQQLIGEANFNQTKVAFACVACDLRTGEEIVINEGKMAQAIMASSSVPAVFPPVNLQGRLLVDGGVTSQIPVEAARKLGADFVIVVNVEENIYHERFRHGMDILFQSDEIRIHELTRLKLRLADFAVNPAVEKFSWAAFSRAEECIRQGELAARKILTRLKSALAKKRRSHFLKRIFFR